MIQMTTETTQSTETASESGSTSQRTWTFVGLGVALWALTAVAVRVAGQFVLVPDAPLVLAGLYLVTVPAVAGVALGLYRLYGVADDDRARVAILVVLPVAVLDAGALLVYGTLFPNLAIETARFFAAWALLAYLGVFATVLAR